ncbi:MULTISPECIES: isoaspartyl peptidase/L-asparaginase [unclassified Lysobacter]|uniref:isoaspartyl peptidase/L-asparaginase family protein n=1 Tax=unclassified Lysobacter TaxID=2635362 RepID=UPI0009E8A26D|nr:MULTISPECIES: isoaspartyl peptidase/L-asparaginase [unclassified Lysobacter]
MRLPILLLSLAAMSSPAALAQTPPSGERPIALVIHGGAGFVPRDALSEADRKAAHADLNRALDAGYGVLQGGGSALDAVSAVVVVLEDSPIFNAGKGAVFNARGGHELDASIMEGHTRRAGAVAGVTTIKNPIKLARAVMEHSPHVMLAGAGAEAFADTRAEIERVPNTYFDTPKRRQQLEKAQREEAAKGKREANAAVDPGKYFGTVGAVALDRQGHIAAATSTGGMTNKRYGRVGDSPVIGAGTWADDRCGVSGTGWGEYYIRYNAAHDICARVAYRGDSLQAAADEVINKLIPAAGGDGGAIALDREGHIAMPFNSGSMFRGWVKPDGSRGTAIHEEE